MAVACAVAVGGFLTGSAAGWSFWLRFCTASVALILVLLAFWRKPIGHRLGGRIERFLADSHQPITQRRTLTILLLVASSGFAWLALGGGQLAMMVVCVGFGGLAIYWGSKVCPNERTKRAAAGIAFGGYMLSLSANFLAGALAGEPMMGKSVHTISRNTTAILNEQQRLHAGLERVQLDQAQQHRQLSLILEHLQRIGPDRGSGSAAAQAELQSAATELSRSMAARDRLAAAIVRRDWTVADLELRTIRADPALAETFDVKMLEGDRFAEATEFDNAIAPYSAALRLKPADVTIRNKLAWAYDNSEQDARAGQHRAIELYEETLALPQITRLEWAETQRLLAWAWRYDLAEHRVSAAPKAMTALESALTVYSRERYPKEWGTLQNAIAIAWGEMPGDETANLTRAVSAFEASLTTLIRTSDPDSWAIVHLNLAMSLNRLAEKKTSARCELWRRAIASLKAAVNASERSNASVREQSQDQLEVARWNYIARKCHTGWGSVPYEDIQPAQ